MAEHLYLVLPEPSGSDAPTSNLLQQTEPHVDGLISDVKRLFWLLDVEDLVMRYDINNIHQYLQFYKDEEGEFYTYSKALRNYVFKEELFEKWNPLTHRISKDVISVYSVPQTNWNTFCEVAKRMTDREEIPMAIVKYDVDKLNDESIPAMVNEEAVSLVVRKLSFEDISEWLETNRTPKRQYVWNPKHGEFGRGAHDEQNGRGEVSVLMSGRDAPKELLPKAIGHLVVREGEAHGNLYIYDENYDMFLRFVLDHSSQTYHAFHIGWEKLPVEIQKKYVKINPKIVK